MNTKFTIDDDKRSPSLERMLATMQRSDIDKEIAKRLKYSQGTADEFMDKDVLDQIMSGKTAVPITDTYILCKIDKTGNLGSKYPLNLEQARRDLAKKTAAPDV